ncbi:MAG: STAS domain-containing protein [Burkholderiales bacterium]
MKNAKQQIAVEGEMTISRAMELKEQLLPACSEGRELEIDLSGVTEIDASGLQLMMAVKLESIVRNVPLSFTGHSAAVQEALELADLGGFFGDPMLITTH